MIIKLRIKIYYLLLFEFFKKSFGVYFFFNEPPILLYFIRFILNYLTLFIHLIFLKKLIVNLLCFDLDTLFEYIINYLAFTFVLFLNYYMFANHLHYYL